jgi:hypothetical protein
MLLWMAASEGGHDVNDKGATFLGRDEIDDAVDLRSVAITIAVAPLVPVMRAAIAALRAYLAGDVRTGRVADKTASDQSDGTENDGACKSAQRCVRHAFVGARGNG